MPPTFVQKYNIHMTLLTINEPTVGDWRRRIFYRYNSADGQSTCVMLDSLIHLPCTALPTKLPCTSTLPSSHGCRDNYFRRTVRVTSAVMNSLRNRSKLTRSSDLVMMSAHCSEDATWDTINSLCAIHSRTANILNLHMFQLGILNISVSYLNSWCIILTNQCRFMLSET